MTEEQAIGLLSQLEQIEKGVTKDIAHVKAQILAIMGNWAIEPDNKQSLESKRLEKMQAKILASYK